MRHKIFALIMVLALVLTSITVFADETGGGIPNQEEIVKETIEEKQTEEPEEKEEIKEDIQEESPEELTEEIIEEESDEDIDFGEIDFSGMTFEEFVEYTEAHKLPKDSWNVSNEISAAAKESVRIQTTSKHVTTGSATGYFAGYCTVRYVTHINGEKVDEDDVEGAAHSYVYCLQPDYKTPPTGTYKCEVIDDEDSGKVATLRKLAYYSPGGYGYVKTAKKGYFQSHRGNSSISLEYDAYAIAHLAMAYVYDKSYNASPLTGSTTAYTNAATGFVSYIKKLPDPPDSFETFLATYSGGQDCYGVFYSQEDAEVQIKKSVSSTAVTASNGLYSVNGTTFALYEEESDAKAGKNAAYTFSISSNGASAKVTVAQGSYYLVETKAGAGMTIPNKLKAANGGVEVEIDGSKTLSF